MIPLLLPNVLIVLILSLSGVLADDFKTLYGKEYKNAQVRRVESDGIVLRTNSGISKVYFTVLPKEVQERFHYDARKAAEFTSLAIEENRLFLEQRGEAQSANKLNAIIIPHIEFRDVTIRE